MFSLDRRAVPEPLPKLCQWGTLLVIGMFSVSKVEKKVGSDSMLSDSSHQAETDVLVSLLSMPLLPVHLHWVLVSSMCL